ncbi:MAG TPA: RtcB family protein [Ktedonobacterales bacterium]|jgi:tRNA-splicing ligase RtcB
MITGKILKLRGWPEGKITGLAKAAAAILAKTEDDQEAVLLSLDLVRMMPGDYLNDPVLGDLARECLRRAQPKPEAEELRDQPLSYRTWGDDQIDPNAKAQMENALRLPIAVAGALMPDAHVGYGLPIGGVLATDHAVIPYAVGVDIACRMRLSIYEAPPDTLRQRKEELARALMDQTRFGSGAAWEKARRPKHPVLDDPAWGETPLLRSLQNKAQEQLGTSGTGNHFVEWGILRLPADDSMLGLKAGEYLALLSHSGSRGVGFQIANTYTELARRLHPLLDQSLRHLSWLPLDSEAGQEYWLSMELAGRFASANHYVIHHRVAGAVGLKEMAHVENHHNFAWSETLPDGVDAIVHRKGATPAGAGVLGIIPGSMGDAGYLVRGKGVASSLNSAAHGAGRKMSRRGALQSISKKERDAYLRERGVTLLGGGLDEAPQAYKDIEQIIAAHSDLIDIVGKFTPRLVRMANEAGDI